MAALQFKRVAPGRYVAHGDTKVYVVTGASEGKGWVLSVLAGEVVAGVRLTGDEVVAADHNDTIALCRDVARAFEDLGDDYSSADHGARSRMTEAVLVAYSRD